MLRSRDEGTIKAGLVLLVEDDPMIRLDIASELRAFGYEVTDCGTADDAYDLMQNQHLSFCALVTDINVPGRMDGLDLANHVAAKHPVMPVVFTTGTPQRLDTRPKGNARERLVAKPYTPPQVLAELRALGIMPNPARLQDDHTAH